MRQFVAPIALIPFAAFSLWVLADVGYVGLFAAALEDGAGQQVLIDLVLACTMLMSLIHRDAKERGVAFWPWALATIVLGSIGPLMYFTYTGWRSQPVDTRHAQAG